MGIKCYSKGGKILVKRLTTLSAALVIGAPVFGHHSDAGLDMNSMVTLEGTITEFNWRNPHVYFTMETTDERGQPVEWALQMASTITVSRMGWTRDSLSPGDRVIVQAHAAQDGRPYGLMQSIEKEGGNALAAAFDTSSSEPLLAEAQVTASTTTLDGRWMADTTSLVTYPGGFDGFFRAQLTLTEEGTAAQAAYDELSDENPEATCVGRPTPGMIISTTLYPLEIEIDEGAGIIRIRSEFFDEERTVHMDGRPHPADAERLVTGHSIGRWEGDVLVVDTRNFSDHRSPYQIGVPFGGSEARRGTISTDRGRHADRRRLHARGPGVHCRTNDPYERFDLFTADGHVPIRLRSGGNETVRAARLKAPQTIFAAAILLSGCFTTGPVDNLPFGEIEQLSDIDGVYENFGESGLAPMWLSQLIWPDVEDLNHDGIELIEVRAVDDVTVAVTATASDAAIVRHETFVEGEDFDLSNGSIQLNRRVKGAPLDPKIRCSG